jgi:hypothetical protein
VGSLACVAVSLCLGAGVLAAGPRGSVASSPAELVASLRTLEDQGCFGEILAHVTPDQREAYLFISWFGAFHDALGGEPEAAERYRAIVVEHGLDEEWLSKDVTGPDRLRRVAADAFRRVDLAELLADLARFRVEHGCGVAFGFVGRLRELHVEEDWALARIEHSEFELLRCDETWSWQPFADLDR